jgi:hypothetical protein
VKRSRNIQKRRGGEGQRTTRTTPLITSLFGTHFRDQLTEGATFQPEYNKGCGKCDTCKKDSCGRYLYFISFYVPEAYIM